MRRFQVQLYQITLSALGVVGMFLVLLTPGQVKADRFVGQRWARSQQVSIAQIRHDSFEALLKRYVDADGYVNYKAWHASRTDRVQLQNYLKQLSRANPSLAASRHAKIAFWINAYNAVTLEGILQVYPTSSIRNHTAKVVGYNIWKQLKLPVGDREYSLEDIEHKMLRKMNEPRIHFSIVCASIGCPRLRNEAYVASRLESQLADNARDFFSRTQNLQVDVQRRTLRMSAIVNWFGSDFGATKSQQLAYLSKYMPAQALQLARQPNVKVSYLKYNWNLNDQSKR